MKDEEELKDFRLRDLFDRRYVLKDWQWITLNSIVFGFVGLVITGFIGGLIAFVYHLHI